MKHSIVLHLIILITVYTNSATAWQDTLRHYLPGKEATALEFQVEGLFDFSGHMGNGITIKKFYDNDKAARFGLYANMYSDLGEGKVIEESFTDSQDTLRIEELDQKQSTNQYTVYAKFQLLKYRLAKSKLALTYGLGPMVGITKTSGEVDRGYLDSYNPDANIRKSSSKYLWLGLSGMIGVEWFIHPAFSIHAENHASFKWGESSIESSHYREYESGNWTNDQEDLTGPRMEYSHQTLLGISIYFD